MFIQRSGRIGNHAFFIHFWRNIFNFPSKKRLYSDRFFEFSIELFKCSSNFLINHFIFLDNHFLTRISLCIKLINITMSYSTNERFSFWFYFTKNFQCRCLKETFIINSAIERLVNYQSNILSFWRFNWTNPTIMRRMHISHLKFRSFSF